MIIYSCDNFKEKEVQNELYSQDFKKIKSQNELVIIDLDSIENFSALRKEMGKIACTHKTTGLKFNFMKTNYHITGFAECPMSVSGCYFFRNVLIIKNDSIIIDKGNRKPIENLKNEIDSIISKPFNFQHDKDIIKPALIYLYIDDKYPISMTKKVLKEIAEQFKNINSANNPDFFQYNILFESMDFFISPPPPPPPLSLIEDKV